MPEIDLGKVKLRTIKLSDYKDMFIYGKDEDVTRYLTWGPYQIESEAKKTIKEIFFPRVKQGLPVGYAIIDTETSKMIGTIDFHTRIKKTDSVEIGFALHKDYWNQGITSMCLMKMIDLGFHYLNYHHVIIKHLKRNVASEKVIKKAGFKLVNIEPYTYEKNKQVIEDDMCTYVMSKEDYDGNQQS